MADGSKAVGALTVASGALASDVTLDLFKRLRRRAIRLGVPVSDADDLAQQTILQCWRVGAHCPRYHMVTLRRIVGRWRRRRRERGDDHVWTYIDDFDEPVEMLRMFTPPNQEPALELARAVRAIEALDPAEREVFMLAVSGDEQIDIAKVFCRSEDQVKNQIYKIRRKVKEACGMDAVSPEQKTSRFRGVNKHLRKWAAYFSKGDKRIYVGLFSTPEEAARAYDDFARAEGRPEHLLNYPNDGSVRNASTRAPSGAKLCAADIPLIRRRLSAGHTYAAIAEDFKVSQDTIRLIHAGRTWKTA